MDQALRMAVEKLGTAINDSVSESDRIAEAMEALRKAGYDIFLVLEATVGFHKREGEPKEAARSVTFEADGNVKFGSKDQAFLRAFEIDPEKGE